MLEIRILTDADQDLFEAVADGVFDFAIEPKLVAEFLRVIVGFVSAVHYVHPDKRPQFWINEVAVAPSYRRRGVARAMLKEVLSLGRQLNCSEAWVLTDELNTAANALYHSVDGKPSHGVVMYSFTLGDRKASSKSTQRKVV